MHKIAKHKSLYGEVELPKIKINEIKTVKLLNNRTFYEHEFLFIAKINN